jgi:hypothetical protein
MNDLFDIRYLASCLSVAWMVVAGCGSSAEKLPLAGEVLVAGNPVAEGSITFTATAGDATAYGTIQNGKFTIPAAGGIPAGSYRVVILGFETTGRQIEDPDFPGQMINEKQSIVPARYNENSQLEVEIGRESSQSLTFQLDAV